MEIDSLKNIFNLNETVFVKSLKGCMLETTANRKFMERKRTGIITGIFPFHIEVTYNFGMKEYFSIGDIACGMIRKMK